MSKINQKVDAAIADYKTLIKSYLELRPSGTRIKLAEAFGTHKSFISQVCNPAYNVPLPSQHIPALFRVLHLSDGEKAAFMEAYQKAHPEQLDDIEELPKNGKVVQIEIPKDLSVPVQQELEKMITEFAERAIALARHTRT
ncbi:hypothetical protein RYZ26_19315 [Terasakiella sp. A23]|uniref:hypothetical protein n=1 Tax=Terasakiella sp. FCG-A23 TaxID=3080561 RepID=UPI0029532B2C|nr:hypothetical protein [Terasakiella sp. A23]MDV7341759.1 hypothetical protein [Terasakiella sp. A23]